MVLGKEMECIISGKGNVHNICVCYSEFLIKKSVITKYIKCYDNDQACWYSLFERFNIELAYDVCKIVVVQ